MGIAFPDGRTFSSISQLPGQRDQMRQFSVINALSFLRKLLLAEPR
jgi:hypothetical protein